MTDGPDGKVETFLAKEEDILTSVARSIGSTLGSVAAKVNAVSSPSRRKKATRKRRPRAKAAKKKRPAKKSKRKSAARKRTARKKSRR
ncbi:MAG: hypothetical protein ABSF68_08770 [Candidatus Acidiferrales bacterium]|jgi:hypothetical protein